MATLVTGGTGFIGSNIVIELAKHGEQVVSLDIIPPDDLLQKNLDPWTDKVSWIQGDILDKEILQKAAAPGNIEKIVHASSLANVIEKVRQMAIVKPLVTGKCRIYIKDSVNGSRKIHAWVYPLMEPARTFLVIGNPAI